MARITLITPFIMTHDLAGSIAFYCDALEFECTFKMENYAFVHQRPAGAPRLLEVDKNCGIAEQMVYMNCDDVDALYADLREKLGALPEGRARAPFDQPYAMREFHVKDPDNCLLMFGTDIPPSPMA